MIARLVVALLPLTAAAQELRPMRPLREPGFWELWWPWVIAGALTFVGIGALAVHVLVKNLRKPRARNPMAEVHDMLACLRDESLDDKSFTELLSRALRTCLIDGRQIGSFDLSNDELLSEARMRADVSPETHDVFCEVLRKCDVVRFAHQNLSPEDRSELRERASALVEEQKANAEQAPTSS